jgi:hypothetical protein
VKQIRSAADIQNRHIEKQGIANFGKEVLVAIL